MNVHSFSVQKVCVCVMAKKPLQKCLWNQHRCQFHQHFNNSFFIWTCFFCCFYVVTVWVCYLWAKGNQRKSCFLNFGGMYNTGWFHQCFTSSFTHADPKSAKKHWWLDCLLLLGYLHIKAAHKHVGEIMQPQAEIFGQITWSKLSSLTSGIFLATIRILILASSKNTLTKPSELKVW